MLNFILIFFISGIFCSSWSHAVPLSTAYDEYEGLDLFEALIRDQQYVQAEEYLQHGPLKKKNLLMSKSGIYEQERLQFLQAELFYFTGQKDSAYKKYCLISKDKNSKHFKQTIYRLAQIEKSRKNWSSCLSQFSYLDNNLNREELLLKAVCYKGMRRWVAAFEIYSDSLYYFEREFVENRIEILIELELFETAKESFYVYLADSQSAIEALTLFHKFRENKVPQYQVLFEGLKLKFRDDLDVLNTAVSVYYENSWDLNMIEELRHLAILDNNYQEYLAEALRIQQKNQLAFFYQIQIKDNEKKYRNQLADYSDEKKWSMILSLEKGYGRSTRKIEDALAYTFAYSHLKYGHLNMAKIYLSEIAQDQMRSKKDKLEKIIRDCESKVTNCPLSLL